MDILAALTKAAATVKQAYDAAQTLENAELTSLLADLASQTSNIKLEVAALKEEIVRVTEENQALKAAAGGEQNPTIKSGCYVTFKGDKEMYCLACWTSKKQKAPTTKLGINRRQCTVCKAQRGMG